MLKITVTLILILKDTSIETGITDLKKQKKLNPLYFFPLKTLWCL